MKKVKRIARVVLIALVSLSIILLIASGINNRIGDTSIEANIQGLGYKFVTFTYETVSGKEFAKFGFSINDKFKFKVGNKEISRARFQIHKKQSYSMANLIIFRIEPEDKVKILGELKDNSISCVALEGSSLCKQSFELREELLPLYIEEYDLKHKYESVTSNNNDELIEIERRLNSIRKTEIPQLELEFSIEHNNYEISAFNLWLYGSTISSDSSIKYANYLTDEVKNHFYGKLLLQYVEGWKLKQGSMAPIITGETFSGDAFELSKLRGKYVVLDFWGSWCGPCIMDIPKLKECYAKYNGEIEIVGIAINDNKSSWERAIKQNELNWIHLLNEPLKNDIQAIYSVSFVPTKVLIDKDGEIIKQYLGYGTEFYTDIDSLLFASKKYPQ